MKGAGNGRVSSDKVSGQWKTRVIPRQHPGVDGRADPVGLWRTEYVNNYIIFKCKSFI